MAATPSSHSGRQALTNEWERRRGWLLLERDAPFCIHEWPSEQRDAVRDAISAMRQAGALRIVDDERCAHGEASEYAWDADAREILAAYHDDERRFADVLEGACEHRLHVYNRRDAVWMGCRYCERDREYDPDRIRAAIQEGER